MSLQTLDDAEMIKAVQERYRAAKAEEVRLTTALEQASDERSKFDAILALKDNCGPALENWPNLKYGEKVNIIRAFIRHIVAIAIDDNGLHLEVIWRDDSRDEVLIIRQTSGADGWLRSDVEKLLHLVDDGASQIEIAQAFPKRKWEQIRRRYNVERPDAPLYFDPQPIQYIETYKAYLKRIQTEKKKASAGDRWTSAEEELLLQLLDAGANAAHLASAFPTRKWVQLRTKIKKLRGKGIRIPGSGEIGRDEVFADFLARTGKGADEYDVTVLGVTSKPSYPA